VYVTKARDAGRRPTPPLDRRRRSGSRHEKQLDPDERGKSVAAAYKFPDGSNGTAVTVNYPPQAATTRAARPSRC